MTVLRQTTPLDHLLTEAQRALDTVFGNPPAARPYPPRTPASPAWIAPSAATRLA